MNKCMTILLAISMFSAFLVASDQPLKSLHEDEMQAIEQVVMARLAEEAHKQSPQSKLNQAMKTEAAKRKLAARIITGIIAVGGVVALIYWLWPKKEAPVAQQAPAPGNNTDNQGDGHHHCGCAGHHGHGHSGHHHSDNDPGRGPVVIVPIVVSDPNACAADVLQEIIHDVQAQVIQQGEDEASRLRGETVIPESPVVSDATSTMSPSAVPEAPAVVETPPAVSPEPVVGRVTRARAKAANVVVPPLWNPTFSDSDSESNYDSDN